MPNEFLKGYWEQMPKYQRITAGSVFNFLGSLASIVALYFTFSPWHNFSNDTKYIIGLSYFFIIILLLLSYILIRESSKKHRYAQTVYYMHFVNHTIRDYLSRARLGRAEPLSDALNEIVNAIAACFSIIEGRQCRCSIKEVQRCDPLTIVTLARDSISKVQAPSTRQHTHHLVANTDFDDLWNGKSGAVRFFVGNNLKTMWRSGTYRNSSFQSYGQPIRHDIFGYSWVTNWRLPYNSSIVWPIRFIPDHQYWPPAAGIPTASDDPLKHPDIWGFLCVDSTASRAFRSSQSAELGAAFADALYTLFTQMVLLDSAAQDTTGRPARMAETTRQSNDHLDSVFPAR